MRRGGDSDEEEAARRCGPTNGTRETLRFHRLGARRAHFGVLRGRWREGGRERTLAGGWWIVQTTVRRLARVSCLTVATTDAAVRLSSPLVGSPRGVMGRGGAAAKRGGGAR